MALWRSSIWRCDEILKKRQNKSTNILSQGLSNEIWSWDYPSKKQIREMIFTCGEMLNYGGMEIFL